MLLLPRLWSKGPLRQNTEAVDQWQKHVDSCLPFKSRVLPGVFTLEVITKCQEERRGMFGRGTQTSQVSKARLAT